MVTLIYFNGGFNRPDTLRPYLQANAGCDTFLQVDCISPFKGTADELADKVCQYFNGIEPMIEVTYNYIQNASTESGSNAAWYFFLLFS